MSQINFVRKNIVSRDKGLKTIFVCKRSSFTVLVLCQSYCCTIERMLI